MRFTRIVLLYFVLGAVMFGGGAISFQEAGVAGFFVEDRADGFGPSDADDELSGLDGAITQLVGEFLGAIQLVYNLVVGLLGYLNWPIVVLLSHNAPPQAVLLLGGSFTAAFYLGVIRLVQSSA